MKTAESRRRIRVLHIVGGMARGGVETWLLHVLRHIDRERFKMDFLVHTAEPRRYDKEIRAQADPSIRTVLRLSPEAFVIGHVGRFDAQKNHGFLLDVFRRIADAEPTARLLLVGDGALRPAMERKAAQMGLANLVVFAGLRSDVPRVLLGAVDVFVMPSLYEGLGLVCLEAQAAGLPCIIADSIPDEADVVPQLVTRLRLSQPASSWATAVLAKRNQALPITQHDALASMEASPFNLHRAVTELATIYQTAIASSPAPFGDCRYAAAHSTHQPLSAKPIAS